MSAYEHNARLFIEEYKKTIAVQSRTIKGMEAELNLLNTKYAHLEDMHDEQYVELRKARQEAQQWEDETCLEIDELDSIIDGQQEYIKMLQEQMRAAFERNLQMSFAVDAAKQELADMKHSHSEVCEMNRRFCLALEKTEDTADAFRQEAAAARAQADNATQDAINCRRANDSLLDINQTLSAKLVAIEQALNPCPTPQQGETVPPRPMWSRYRSE
jgi:uncharacterized coiled-coil protein SlyX